MRTKLWGLLVLSIVAVSMTARGEVIRFPENELATESVLPVFDHPESVKSRRVVTAKRIELGGYVGYNLTEPFFNPLNIGASATYHLNEDSGINLFATYFMTGVSSNATKLNGPGIGSTPMNLQLAPRPKYLLLGNYQFTAFYGKLSISKSYVLNLSLYGLGGAGMISIGDKMFPALSVGLGQKFYFNPSLAFRFDLRFLFYQGPNILSKQISGTAEKPADYFEKKFMVGTLLSGGVVWLIPNS